MFQSLSRDSWWSNEPDTQAIKPVPIRFNPSVGILGGQTSIVRAIHFHIARFNPSVGILGGQTRMGLSMVRGVGRFQSLSRDSWWSNIPLLLLLSGTLSVSIPQSGFLVVKPSRFAHIRASRTVSIPQSGFLVVKRNPGYAGGQAMAGFNPSVGILGGQTSIPCSPIPPGTSVSIPQSGFLVVKLECGKLLDVTLSGFNPSVGILGGQTWVGFLLPSCTASFNPSVGILGGQTGFLRYPPTSFPRFQSLSRDSWWSNATGAGGGAEKGHVSIPQSGFLVVKPSKEGREGNERPSFQSLSRDSWWSNKATATEDDRREKVSIPQSGFLVVKHHLDIARQLDSSSFNPSVGILGGQTRRASEQSEPS